MKLTSSYTRVAAEEDSEFYKQHFPEKRSWWISTQGAVIDSGHNHAKFVREHPEIFGGLEHESSVFGLGWIKVGFFGGNFYLEGHTINKRQLEAIQSLRRSLGWAPYVDVVLLERGGKLSTEDFLSVDSPAELRRELWGNF